MIIGILPIGQADTASIIQIKKNLEKVLPDTTCLLIEDNFPLREDFFEKKRKQYRSNAILNEIQGYAARKRSLDRVLGVVDADIFVPELNFVFGEAGCLGKAALISLWRLRPEFYGDTPNVMLFFERAVKEAVHELGHTLGLRHCWNSFCVMHFSISISETDIKQSLFCDTCYSHASTSIKRLDR